MNTEASHYWNGPAWGWKRLWITPGGVQDAVRRRYGIAADSATFLAAGMLNQSWRISSADGDFVLRVTRADRTREQIEYEHSLTTELHKSIVVVIPPEPGLDHGTLQEWQNRPVSLFRYVDGIPGTELRAETRMSAVADVLGQIHHRTAILRWPQRTGFRSVRDEPRWVWKKFEATLRQALGTTDVGRSFEVIDSAVTELDVWLDAAWRTGDLGSEAVIHGDFNNRNILFQDGVPAASLCAVIDWDDCCVNPLAWELAQVAFRTGEYDVKGFCDVYVDAGGPVETRDIELLSNFAVMGELSELEWTVDDGIVGPRAAEQVQEVAATIIAIQQRTQEIRTS
ncbi:phosphotransferase enzyme family protein [Kribbella italica]|uniref:Ser/Thr protein kinase RdoA (MazF antagonist) n=1 Tax=Kribbella italica TaxID=1540520 RepID=A0A7W9J5F7_9ACTN|nr:phosphotransferase [Kribbella italica]MBB5835853.1 Ser/Thr protein kinase RdoA (MazF antagonist) [Kribbella italica]